MFLFSCSSLYQELHLFTLERRENRYRCSLLLNPFQSTQQLLLRRAKGMTVIWQCERSPQKQEPWAKCHLPGPSGFCIKQVYRGKAFLLCKHHPRVLLWEPACLLAPSLLSSSAPTKILRLSENINSRQPPTSKTHGSGQGRKWTWIKVTCILCEWSLITTLRQRGWAVGATQDTGHLRAPARERAPSCQARGEMRCPSSRWGQDVVHSSSASSCLQQLLTNSPSSLHRQHAWPAEALDALLVASHRNTQLCWASAFFRSGP